MAFEDYINQDYDYWSGDTTTIAAPKAELHEVALEEAKRDPIDYLYTSLEPDFLEALAKIGAHAARKFAETGGADNYKRSILEGDKSPVNHMYAHLSAYRQGQEYDHVDVGYNCCYHLAAIAYNAMMEWYYYNNPTLDDGADSSGIHASNSNLGPQPIDWNDLGSAGAGVGMPVPVKRAIEYSKEEKAKESGPFEKLANMFGWKSKDN